jgi:hypothetical protein
MVDYYTIFKELNDNILQKPTVLSSAIKKPMDISNVSAWIIGLGAVIMLFLIFIYLADNDQVWALICGLLIPAGMWITIVFFQVKNQNYIKAYEAYNRQVKINKSIEKQRKLINEYVPNAMPDSFYKNGQKIYKFCKFYYSENDPNFCKDNTANRYTFNKIFNAIYGKDNKQTNENDLQKAVSWIEKN